MATQKDILDAGQTRKRYKGRLISLSWKLEQAEGRTRTAGNALLFIAAFHALPPLFRFLSKKISGFDLTVELIYAGLFVACFFISKKSPIAAFAIALLLYWGLSLIAYFVLGTPFISGIVWTFVFSGIILAGLCNAVYCDSLRDKLRKLEHRHPEDVVWE